MRPSAHIHRAIPGLTRLLGGAALLVFVSAFFALPLWAAATMCAMPCCHHGGTPDLAFSMDMTSCLPQCTLQTVDASETATAVVVPADSGTRGIVVTPAAALPIQSAQARVAPHAPAVLAFAHAPAAPLHVLNSTFRI